MKGTIALFRVRVKGLHTVGAAQEKPRDRAEGKKRTKKKPKHYISKNAKYVCHNLKETHTFFLNVISQNTHTYIRKKSKKKEFKKYKKVEEKKELKERTSEKKYTSSN